MFRIAVLASGSGTNLQAILDASAAPGYPAEVVVVLSDRPGCGALARAAAAGIPTETVTWDTHRGDRGAFTRAIVDALAAYDVGLVVLAGFMRILSTEAIDAYPGRIVNTHPAILPAFRGAHAVEDAIAAGVKLTGVTVHVVVPEVDAGPIIAQEAVPVRHDDSVADLQRRIQEVEHRLYPEVIARWARGELSVEDGRVREVENIT